LCYVTQDGFVSGFVLNTLKIGALVHSPPEKVIPMSNCAGLSNVATELGMQLSDFYAFSPGVTVTTSSSIQGQSSVICDQNNVTISDMVLFTKDQKSLPTALGSLGSVRRMFIVGNWTNAIPKELGDLSSLWSLSIRDTKLVGPFPPELSKLPLIRFILVNNPEIKSKIPEGYGNWTNDCQNAY
jgi:hypothetical protein